MSMPKILMTNGKRFRIEKRFDYAMLIDPKEFYFVDEWYNANGVFSKPQWHRVCCMGIALRFTTLKKAKEFCFKESLPNDVWIGDQAIQRPKK